MKTYIATLGWLKGKQYNNVTLSEKAILETLEKLQGASVYAEWPLRNRIGNVMTDVIQGLVFVELDDDVEITSADRPALELRARVWDGIIELVERADIFITQDDNGNTLDLVEAE